MPANAVNLERRLALVAWVTHQLGYDDNAAMLSDLKECSEEWSGRQSNFMRHRILGRAHPPEIQKSRLIEFDANICGHLQVINERRRLDERIVLKYFQYLAALAMEIVLWRRAASREKLLDDLVQFVGIYNARHSKTQLPQFQPSDMNKIAFWMATGSGKTLLMHLNYRQFLHWRPFSPSNILLVTPNEELSRQHFEEMRRSSIPCARHGESEDLFDESKHAVRIIEITKLKTEKGKKGKGVSVPVESFAGRNLVFVDEGHKGAGGKEYFKMRDALVNEGGFAAEYSATFGQALQAAERDERSEEYARAILFDYSYRYFHGDGYGKDFRVLNLSGEIPDDKKDLMLLGNLLSFCQQKIAYESNRDEFARYNIESPLMLMLGATVEGKTNADADVVEFINFLSRVASDRNAQGRRWLREGIRRILNGESGINNEDGDIFANRFPLFFSKFENNAEDISCDLLKRIFRADGGCHGALRLSQIKRASKSNEIAVHVGEGKSPFALINVGAAAKVCEMVKNDDNKKIELRPDVISSSLFERINDRDSSINILIGAKKFMEGWSSWRVSGMGLLNVGRSEGSQIIQLFGRGVRLKGKDMSLKRSSALQGISHPQDLEYVETLNIFAIRAEFMAKFRDYLSKEGIAEKMIYLPIRKQKAFFKKGLMLLEFPAGEKFDKPLCLAVEEGINVSLDMTASVQAIEATETPGNFTMNANTRGQDHKFRKEELDLLDMDALRIRLLKHKQERGYGNLWIEENECLRTILRNSCSIKAPENFLSVDGWTRHPHFSALAQINIIAADLLCKYADSLFGRHLRKWQTEKAQYSVLEERHSNFQNYCIRLNKEDDRLMRRLETIINDANMLQADDNGEFPRIYFDRHLYWPLLLEKEGINAIPPGLNAGEKDFVEKLRDYAKRNPQPPELKGCEIFLLRNLSRGKGIGFYETQGFYPDFILWIKRGNFQQIIFVEPHGMFMEDEYQSNEKARLHEKMKEITRNLGEKNIKLDSFIISRTPFDQLRNKWGKNSWTKKDFDNRHILFFDDDYISAIFRRR